MVTAMNGHELLAVPGALLSACRMRCLCVLGLSVLALSTGAEAASDKEVQSLLRKSASPDAKQRAFAIAGLARLKQVKHGARFLKTVREAGAFAPEVAPVFRLWVHGTPKGGQAAAQAWLKTATAKSVKEPAAARNVIAFAHWYEGSKASDSVRDGLLLWAAHPDKAVAKAVLAALAAQPRLQKADAAAPLLEALGAHPRLELKWVALLGASKDLSVAPELAQAAQAFADNNPRSGAPEHIEALRQLTERDLGADPEAWTKAYPAKAP